MGPGPVQISEKFGYVKVTVAELANRPADIGNGDIGNGDIGNGG